MKEWKYIPRILKLCNKMMVDPIRFTPRQHRIVPIEYEALGPRASPGAVKGEVSLCLTN
jgi:hypothetical protein